MNEHQTKDNPMNRDRIISASDFFEEILRRIWLIIVLAIVFAVLFAGYKYMADRSKVDTTTQSASYTEAENSLTDEEMREVDSVLKLYDEVAAQEEYMQNSVLMNIDPYHENRVTLQFLLQSDHDDMPSILQAMESYVTGGSLVAELREFYPDEDSAYLSELITSEQGNTAQTEEVSATEEDRTAPTEMNAVFGVQVVHSDSDEAEQLADAVTQCLEDYAKQLNSSLGNCKISLLERNATQVYDSVLQTNQTNLLSNQITQQNKIVTQRESMSDDQIKVLEASLAGNTEESMEANTSAGAGTQADAKVRISKRYVAYGIIVGIILGIILIALYYIFRGTLNVAQEMPAVFGIPVFGQVHTKRQRNPLVRAWRRLTTKKKAIPLETEQQIALANLKNFCKNNQLDRILLTGSREALSEDAWLQEVKKELQKEQMDVGIVGGLPVSPAAIEEMNAYQHVALVETLHVSAYVDVVREVEICKEQSIQVIGSILLG